MTDEFNTVSEDELHAYVDGHLSKPERERIEAWLKAHPAEAKEVRQWQAHAAALKQHFAGYARSDAGDRALLSAPGRVRATPVSAARPLLRRVAAALLIFIAGAFTGAYAPRLVAPIDPRASSTDIDSLPEQAQSAFLVYASEVRHPVEVGADQQAHLATWLGKRLDYDLELPDLSTLGFSLVGGRLIPVSGAAGAMLMYEDATGRRLTVLLGRNLQNRETSFRIASHAGVETFYWIDREIGYAVTGELARDLLQKIAEECYRQFEGTSAS